MKDHRIEVFRTATLGLIESLDAVVRLSRWGEVEPPPEPLVAAAGKLVDRLGAANRLAGGKFNGSPRDATRVTTMCTAMKRLDAAYVAYRKEAATPDRAAGATSALEVEIGAASVGVAALEL